MKPGRQARSTRAIMLTVAGCLLPGLIAAAWLIDPVGVLENAVTALLAAFATERACTTARRVPVPLLDTDPAAAVTALIIAAALPPGAIGPVAGAVFVALTLGKHVYGGLGSNIFNPAMVGYAVMLVSFPAAMADWPVITAPTEAAGATVDALTGATVLTTFKYRGTATVAESWTAANGFGHLGGLGYEWVGVAFLAGGVVLMALKMAAWRPCAGMLAALVALALVGYDNGSSASLGSPMFHLFSGGTLLAATFVATDPVSHPSGHGNQWRFGAVVGALTWIIRAWGNYPDGIAFAVLLGNAVTPFLDRRTVPRSEIADG
ncbi:MAG: RnfABCDGE type electron transport complex subunit D [Gammaproteobacteria bacterium]